MSVDVDESGRQRQAGAVDLAFRGSCEVPDGDDLSVARGDIPDEGWRTRTVDDLRISNQKLCVCQRRSPIGMASSGLSIVARGMGIIVV
jgi:hypothetical protein